MELMDIPPADRRLIATWAIKTARTEEWTGQQVLRLLPTTEDPEYANAILLHAADEFRHAQLYAELAEQLVAGTAVPGALFTEYHWLRDYAVRRNNFRDAEFTGIFRVMDSIPMCLPAVCDVSWTRTRFYTALFFLDLAGLMTVNVYDEAPLAQVQKIALEIREDESRHVQLGRDYLTAGHTGARDHLQEAVREFLPHILFFFGGDESPTQKALQKHGFRSTPNKELFERFKKKVSALLKVEAEYP